MLKKHSGFHPDPTKTLGLRNKALADINRHFKALKTAVKAYFAPSPLAVNDNGKTDEQKMSDFEEWLSKVIAYILLGNLGDEPSASEIKKFWFTSPIALSYLRGFTRAGQSVTVPDVTFNPYFTGTYGDSAAAQFLFSKDYTGFKGITEAMSNSLAQILADGLLDKLDNEEIIQNILDKIDTIGVNKANFLSRTAIVEANARGILAQGDRLSSILGEEVYYLWTTQGDERVRLTHRERADKIYTKAKAVTLLGEPNCRCGISPVPESKLNGRKVLN